MLSLHSGSITGLRPKSSICMLCRQSK
jgi:hypothetical protein